jgi:hypothetical protein
MITYPRELMHQGKPAQYDLITHFDMTSKRGVVREDAVIPNNTVMGNMDIGHDQVVITNDGFIDTGSGTTVYGAAFSKGITVTDNERTIFALEF